MIFRTLLFFVVIYLLIKIISRLFLPSKQKQNGRSKGPSIFYRTFEQMSQQQNNDRKNSGNNSRRFEEIEEAEYEEITDEEETTSKSSE